MTRLLPSRLLPETLLALHALGLYAGELARPLRPDRHEPKFRRAARNLALASISGLVVALLQTPLTDRLSRWVLWRRFGLLQLPVVSSLSRPLLSLALMDYTLFVWHILTHRVPFLWRFHLVHHLDADMDVSTALRFHFGEMLLSIPWRLAQILLLGVGPADFKRWQTLTVASILFHHADIRLNPVWESRLARIIVTPRLHGIHHSRSGSEMNSNWSSGLSWWDRLHGTYRDDVPQEAVSIGVPGYGRRQGGTLRHLLRLPFTPAAGHPYPGMHPIGPARWPGRRGKG